MSAYGTRTDSNGEEIKADGKNPVIVGEQVDGNKIVNFGLYTDESGNPVDNRAVIQFKQTNGATFTYSFFDSDQDWAVTNNKRTMLHICTKIVSEDEYYAAIEGATSFADWINKIKDNIMPKASNMSFRLKIVYRQNKSSLKIFPTFPAFPNFIEPDGTTPSGLSTNPKYDFYTTEHFNTTPVQTASGIQEEATDDVEF